MAIHKVKMNLPWRDVGKADIKFRIQQNGELFGTMKISRGALEWFPKNAKKAYKTSWTKFDSLCRQKSR